MYYVSLGRHCDIAYNIKKHIQKDCPTQFFDWVRSDFKSILKILFSKSIEEYLNLENIILDDTLFPDSESYCVQLKNILSDHLTLWFRHDIHKKENEHELEKEIKEFIEKYKRRHHRLIELIQSSQTICFIHRNTDNTLDYNDCQLFDTYLKEINPNIRYKLIILDYNESKPIFIEETYYSEINLYSFVDPSIPEEWTNEKYDWISIFNCIEEITKSSEQ